LTKKPGLARKTLEVVGMGLALIWQPGMVSSVRAGTWSRMTPARHWRERVRNSLRLRLISLLCSTGCMRSTEETTRAPMLISMTVPQEQS
jgi:hypothetical protein